MRSSLFPYTKNIETIQPEDYRDLVDMALREDAPGGDISGEAFSRDQSGHARLVARQNGILCGWPVFEAVFARVDREIVIQHDLSEGQILAPGQELARFKGPAAAILRAERPALNFLGLLSGIATQVHRIMEKVRTAEVRWEEENGRPTGPLRLLDTRKTLPGFRYLSKYAVHTGGGTNHRLNLTEMGMIKENHIRTCGGLTRAVELFREKNPAAPFEIEITSPTEAREVAALPERNLPVAVLLDNMDNETMVECDRHLPAGVAREASGNFTEANITRLVGTPVQAVSLGSITKAPEHFDFSLQFE